MLRVLRIGRTKLKERGVASAAKEVAALDLQTSLTREAMASGLLDAFRERYGGTLGELSAEELTEAEGLAETKYGRAEWTNEFE